MAAVPIAAIVLCLLPAMAENNCGTVRTVRTVTQYAMWVIFSGAPVGVVGKELLPISACIVTKVVGSVE